MSYYPVVVSDPKVITYPSRTRQSNSRENHVFHYLQRVTLSVAPFANVCAPPKFYVWILHISYYPVVVSDPKVITYPSRTSQLNVRENHVLHYLQRVMLSVAPFANVCATQKNSESSLYMSYCVLIASDPDYITYPSRTRQLNVRENQRFSSCWWGPSLRKSRKMRSHEKITWHYFSIIWARVFWISSGETKFQGDRPDS